MAGSDDGDGRIAEFADVTLFGHLQSPSPGTPSLRRVTASAHQDPSSLLLSGDGRYELQGLIGRGGAGEVHRVLDRKLNRVVALKLLRLEFSSDAQMIARFTREAQVISQLEHPSIIPIYDLGRAESGRWYLTMKEVHGRTFRECIAALHDSHEGYSLRQAIDALQRVSTAVGYAHGKGVLHRDLKPDNIMIAEFGQVYVLDWGLARILEAPQTGVTNEPYGDSSEMDKGLVMGTPAFMSPEQARADLKHIGPTSDVWSLGATLYAVLYGEPPFTGTAQEVLDRVELGPPSPPKNKDAPVELVELWQSCMSLEPANRPANGTAVAHALSLFLEGREHQEKALGLVEEARAMIPDLETAREAKAHAASRARTALRTLRQSDDLQTKEKAWKLEDIANQNKARLEYQFDRILTKARMAHDHAPRLADVRSLLAELYRRRASEAESAGDTIAAQSFKKLVATYDDGRHSQFLKEEGTVYLKWSPPTAQARISRFEQRARRWAPVPLAEQNLRTGISCPLATGRYLVELREPNHAPLRVPIHVESEQAWSHCPPGQDSSRVLVLQPTDLVARQERFISGGWFQCGGDDRALNTLPRQRLWAEPFLIASRPVSHQEFLLFLNSTSQKAPAAALQHAPRVTDSTGHNHPLYEYDPVSRSWQLQDQVMDLVLHPTNPVIGVSWVDAQAYLQWLQTQTGHPWRLPGELEWELAARGVDGRSFPWGEQSDPTFFCHQETHLEVMGPPATGRFPVDSSPYGVLGMAGGVAEWCADNFHPQGPERKGPAVTQPATPDPSQLLDIEMSTLKCVRGGAWRLSSAHGRCASRWSQPANRHTDTIGFRLCRSAPHRTSNR